MRDAQHSRRGVYYQPVYQIILEHHKAEGVLPIHAARHSQKLDLHKMYRPHESWAHASSEPTIPTRARHRVTTLHVNDTNQVDRVSAAAHSLSPGQQGRLTQRSILGRAWEGWFEEHGRAGGGGRGERNSLGGQTNFPPIIARRDNRLPITRRHARPHLRRRFCRPAPQERGVAPQLHGLTSSVVQALPQQIDAVALRAHEQRCRKRKQSERPRQRQFKTAGVGHTHIYTNPSHNHKPAHGVSRSPQLVWKHMGADFTEYYNQPQVSRKGSG